MQLTNTKQKKPFEHETYFNNKKRESKKQILKNHKQTKKKPFTHNLYPFSKTSCRIATLKQIRIEEKKYTSN